MTRPRVQTPSRWVLRYATGRPLDGYPRTDATFFSPGTRAVNETGRAGKWHMQPGWKRAAWRLTTPAALVSGLAGYLTHPVLTEVTAGSATLSGGVYAGFRARKALRNARHARVYVRPFHRTLGDTLGIRHPHPGRWLSVPVNFADENAEPVRVQLPADTRITPEMKVAVREIVGQKLGLHDPIEVWHTVGRDPYVTFKPAPRPPERVSWEDVAEHFRAAEETAPVLGIGRRNAIITADLDADSPHIAVSAAPGAGKSVLVANILIHGLHHGAGVVILDYKRASHSWAEGLPGVVIAKNIEDIHEWAIRVDEEGERRNRAADEPGGFVGHRIYLVVEEWNILSAKLQMYWEAIREKDDSKKSPAVQSIANMAFTGRHVKINLIGVAQLMTARTTGGPEVRDCFASRCLARHTVNAWKMLVPEVWPMPKKSKIHGRWFVVKAGESHETQVAMPLQKIDGRWVLVDGAREWCLSGVANPTDFLGPSKPPTQGKKPGTVPATPRLVGLREAVEGGLLPGKVIDLEALRKRRQRDKSFPPAVGKNGTEDLFELSALVQWKTRIDAVRLVEEVA